MKEEGISEAKGTTTVALVCKNGIVMTTDTRATAGHFIASTEAKKVYVIDDLKAMTIAGSVGDAQEIVRTMQALLKQHRMSTGKSMSVNACANLLANWLNGNSRIGSYFSVQVIIGGIDQKGPSIYGIDAAGGVISDSRMISTGSGSPIAYGDLENSFRDNLTIEKAVDVAIRAIYTATKRDAASGNGIKVLTITKEGCHEVPSWHVDEKMEELKKNKGEQ